MKPKNFKFEKKFIKEYNYLFNWNEPNAGCVGFIKYLGKKDISILSEDLALSYKVLIIPSLYFNLNKNYFCWKIIMEVDQIPADAVAAP